MDRKRSSYDLFRNCLDLIASGFTILLQTDKINVRTYFILLLQILSGVVQSTGWPGVVTVVGNWFGKRKRGEKYVDIFRLCGVQSVYGQVPMWTLNGTKLTEV